MHYACIVITKEFPTDDVLYRMVEPFNEGDFYEKFTDSDRIGESDYPPFLWDYWRVGGRYGGGIKLRIDKDDNTPYNWQFYAPARAGRLYRSRLVENQYDLVHMLNGKYTVTFSEEDIYSYLGWDDGFLRVDGAKISDVLNLSDLDCHQFIDKDGKGYTRNWWNGKDFIPNPDFDKQLSDALADSADCYICYLDMHD